VPFREGRGERVDLGHPSDDPGQLRLDRAGERVEPSLVDRLCQHQIVRWCPDCRGDDAAARPGNPPVELGIDRWLRPRCGEDPEREVVSRLVPEQQLLETVEDRLGAHDVLDLHGPSVRNRLYGGSPEVNDRRRTS